jgi:UTP--glucose-1-phosphate uridylyltransferase
MKRPIQAAGSIARVDGLEASIEKMRAEGVADAAIETFRDLYTRWQEGETGLLPESDIEPLRDVPSLEDLPEEDAREALDATVVLKLNGGLGTSMGMTRAKSLLPVKDGLTFLDVIARQVLDARERLGARLPLVLMNSFATREDSLEALSRVEGIESDVPADFVQSKEPKIREDDGQPVQWPDDPGLEWAPPGHGDVYPSLVGSGMLDTLLEQGYRYLFISNSDNLGAVLDPRILAWMAREEIPFLSEVADRTEADRKGGHLAVRKEDGGLVLRESAQVPDEDADAFSDTTRHTYFNTNNLWVDLHALQPLMEDGVLGLPLIVNRKTVDPNDKGSTPVIQLETAMGAAVGVFRGARALRVPRTRFAPVKTTSDLLVLRSDAYELTGDARLVLADGRSSAPLVSLDDDFYKRLQDFDERFPDGAPSLVDAERLKVDGDVTFGAGVVVRGSVTVEGPKRLDAGTVLEG